MRSQDYDIFTVISCMSYEGEPPVESGARPGRSHVLQGFLQSGLTNAIIYTNIRIVIEYGRKQVLTELNRESGIKPERSRHCEGESCALCHWGRYAYPGKACKAMKPSQENCLL